MSGITEREVLVKARNGNFKKGVVRIQDWSSNQRLQRAGKVLGLSWFFALVSVCLPIAHFVLVPGFFIGGPVAAFWIYRQESVVLGGESVCPDCDKPLTIVRGPNKWPLEDMCSACQSTFVIE